MRRAGGRAVHALGPAATADTAGAHRLLDVRAYLLLRLLARRGDVVEGGVHSGAPDCLSSIRPQVLTVQAMVVVVVVW